MDLIKAHNEKYRFFADIAGTAMKVYNEYRPGLMESAYEVALEYLLKEDGHIVERQKFLPIYWRSVQLEQHYRLDLVVDGVICELKAVGYVDKEHRKQLWSYMNLTHTRYGMLINFGQKDRLFSEWYERYPDGTIERVRLV